MQLIIDTATDNFADIEDATILLLGILSRNPDGVSLGALAMRAGLTGNDPAAAFNGGSTPNAAFGTKLHDDDDDAGYAHDDDDDGGVQTYVQLGGTLPPVTTPPAAAAAAPRPPASAGPELDADGMPWDANLHATGRGGSRPKTADGRWRKKRGAPDAPAPQPAAAPVQVIPVVAPTPAPVAAAAPPPPAASGETPAQAFARFMQDIKPMSASDPQFTPMLVGQVLPQIGLTNLIDLTKNPDKIPQLRTMLGLPA